MSVGTVRAVSIDARLDAARDPGRVIATHRRTCTLETEAGTLITLAAPELGNGPNAVLVAPRPWPVGTRFTPLDHGLRFAAGPSLDWSKARRWSAADSAPSAPPTIDNAAALATALERYPIEHGLLPIVLGKAPTSPMQRALAAQAGPSIAALPAPDAARSLIGLGPGATPAGDDLLVGLLLTLHYARHPQAQALRELARSAYTTRLGRALLHWAADGLAREPTLLLLRDLFTQPAPAWLDRIETVLHYGASSGADTLAGIMIGLRLVGMGEAGSEHGGVGCPPSIFSFPRGFVRNTQG
ncbi:MAG TPA: DUF2877 domain-containing protein [Herpetosiphonaceae bacterium]